MSPLNDVIVWVYVQRVVQTDLVVIKQYLQAIMGCYYVLLEDRLFRLFFYVSIWYCGSRYCFYHGLMPNDNHMYFCRLHLRWSLPDFGYPILAIWNSCFQKTFKLFGFPVFLLVSAPNENYFRNASCALN